MKVVFSLLLSLGVLISPLAAESTVKSGPANVEVKTYQKDGNTVTERTITTQATETEVSPNPKTFRTAIFVSNRIGAEMDPKMDAFDDLVTARVTDLGFKVLSKEVVADSLRKFDSSLASTHRPADSLDTKLSEQSSALRLAQGLGADYLLVASLTSIGTKERAVSAYGVNALYTDTTLRVTYKVIDGQTGATITAGNDKAVYSSRQTENAVEKNSDVSNELMDIAAEKIAGSLSQKVAQAKITAPTAPAKVVSLTLNIEAADIAIPDIRIEKNNTVTIAQGSQKVIALNAAVEIDGVAVGTAPGKLTVKPGFSKLRITREGFKPWERTINVFDGQVLTVALEMTEAGYARWKDATAFLNNLNNGAKLTDAQVEVLKGQAKMFSQSGYKVDTKDAPSTNIFHW